MISYKPFFETLKNKNLNQYLLIHDLNISPSTIDRLKKDKYISLETIDKLCNILQCGINDIVSIF